MDIGVAIGAKERVERLLGDADKAAAHAHKTMDRLALEGIEAAQEAGVHPSMLGNVFTYVGKAQKAASDLIAALGGIHYHLHKTAASLELQEPVEKAGGGGGKGDPPPPEG